MPDDPPVRSMLEWRSLPDAHVDRRSVIATCAGCGMPVDSTNPRCQVVAPGSTRGAYGTYGPCCARMTMRERRRWTQNRSSETTITMAAGHSFARGDILEAAGGRVTVVDATGTTLTVRPCPWWRWALSWAATWLRRAKWWLLCLVEPWLPDA